LTPEEQHRVAGSMGRTRAAMQPASQHKTSRKQTAGSIGGSTSLGGGGSR